MTNRITIVIGADSAGLGLKQALRDHLLSAGYLVAEVSVCIARQGGPLAVARAVAEEVADDDRKRGVVVLGEPGPVAAVASAVPGVRAAHIWDLASAELAAVHDHANVVVLSPYNTSADRALELADQWLAGGVKSSRDSTPRSWLAALALGGGEDVGRMLEAVYG